MKIRAIILSAGKGERLWPLTKFKPKPLIDLGDGTTILERQLDVLLNFDEISDILVVVGYKGHMIEEKIKSLGIEDRVKTIYNPFYESFNNLVSLWLALLVSHGFDALLITNGDNLFKPSLIEKLLGMNKEGIYLAVDIKDKYDSDDMKVEIVDGVIKWVSKDIPLERTSAESTGISLIKGTKYISIFKLSVEKLIRKREFLMKFWLEAFNELTRYGNPAIPVFVSPSEWIEMDIHSDRDLIQYLLSRKRF